MNRTVLTLAFALCLISVASATDCDVMDATYCRDGRAKCYGSVDYLYWTARRNGLDFAILDADTDNNIEGQVQSLELESNSGVRASLGYRTACNWDLSFTYTHFDTDDARSVDAPGGGQLWLTRTNPASFNNASATAVAEASLDYDVFDIQAGYWLQPNEALSVRLFGGPRAITTEQAMDVRYAGGTITSGGRQQQQLTKMDGFGLRAGGEAHWHLCSMLSIFGSAAGSVLVGDFSVAYLENEPGLNTGNVSTTNDYFNAVPGLDLAAGLNLNLNHFAVQTGYELTSLFNMDQRTNYTGAPTIARGDLTATSQDLLLDGLFVRLIYAH